jgi:hypothetical protein
VEGIGRAKPFWLLGTAARSCAEVGMNDGAVDGVEVETGGGVGAVFFMQICLASPSPLE